MDLTQPLTDSDPMPFGKYKGVPMVRVPDWYLISLAEADWVEEQWPEVWDYIEDNWDVLNTNN